MLPPITNFQILSHTKAAISPSQADAECELHFDNHIKLVVNRAWLKNQSDYFDMQSHFNQGNLHSNLSQRRIYQLHDLDGAAVQLALHCAAGNLDHLTRATPLEICGAVEAAHYLQMHKATTQCLERTLRHNIDETPPSQLDALEGIAQAYDYKALQHRCKGRQVLQNLLNYFQEQPRNWDPASCDQNCFSAAMQQFCQYAVHYKKLTIDFDKPLFADQQLSRNQLTWILQHCKSLKKLTLKGMPLETLIALSPVERQLETLHLATPTTLFLGSGLAFGRLKVLDLRQSVVCFSSRSAFPNVEKLYIDKLDTLSTTCPLHSWNKLKSCYVPKKVDNENMQTFIQQLHQKHIALKFVKYKGRTKNLSHTL